MIDLGIRSRLRRLIERFEGSAAQGGKTFGCNTAEVNIGIARRRIYYRAGTNDQDVIFQIFNREDYNLGKLRRSSELFQFYNLVLALGKSPLIVDAGANIGASPIYFAYSFPRMRVIAIEPEQSNFELLVANSQWLPIQCVRKAIAFEPGFVNVIPRAAYWSFQTSPAGENNSTADSVACVTVNEIYNSNALDFVPFPFIVKIDIEDSEHNLFSGNNTEWVGLTPLIIVELHDWLLLRENSRPFPLVHLGI
jgi:FkbM family methyltransferase